MSQIVELLKEAADLEKRAYFDYVKTFASSGIATLVKGGVGFDKAAQIMKESCEQDRRIGRMATNSQAFEKAAEYVANLEVKIEELEKIAGTFVRKEEIEASEPLHKLAGLGFTSEEIEHISSLPEDLIEKMASASSGIKPWEMGSGTGMAREKTDPLLEFMLS